MPRQYVGSRQLELVGPIADLPVELDGAVGHSIRQAERELAERLVERYENALATRKSGTVVDGIDHDLVRQVAGWERADTTVPRYHQVIVMLALVLTGIVLGQVIRRVHRLGAMYAQAVEDGRERER